MGDKYLVMVTPDNHNKYYKMIIHGSTWTAEYGRVGYAPQKKDYPLGEFDKKYNEKIRKGYIDQTSIMMVQSSPSNDTHTYSDIADKSVADLMRRLINYATKVVKANYSIAAEAVTTAMVDEAQYLIDALERENNLASFNNLLLRLFTTIPRAMSQVDAYLAHNIADKGKIMLREQNILNAMRAKVNTTPIKQSNDKNDEKTSILKELGITVEPATDKDIAIIKKALGRESADKFVRAWRVVNAKTQKRFDEYIKDNHITDVRSFWHGSRNENWLGILKEGLVLHPANAYITGKMFGYGTYYAPRAKKSIGYTSLMGSYWANGTSSTGFMALMDVAYGKPYDVYQHRNELCSFDYGKLQRACPGANCLHAHAGSSLRNDEIIVYKEEQSTIRYLVEIA